MTRRRRGRARGGERGSAVIEFPMVVGFVLIPFGLLILSAPTWVERQTAARDAAAESARQLVVSADPASLPEIIREIESGYGLPVGTLVASVPTNVPAPGTSVTVAVTVEVPALSLPILGAVGSVDWTAVHTERFPDYGAGP